MGSLPPNGTAPWGCRRTVSPYLRGDRATGGARVDVAPCFFRRLPLTPTFMPPALHVTPLTARRFLRRALGLDAPHADLATVLAHHGYIQIDPLNVCGRM